MMGQMAVLVLIFLFVLVLSLLFGILGILGILLKIIIQKVGKYKLTGRCEKIMVFVIGDIKSNDSLIFSLSAIGLIGVVILTNMLGLNYPVVCNLEVFFELIMISWSLLRIGMRELFMLGHNDATKEEFWIITILYIFGYWFYPFYSTWAFMLTLLLAIPIIIVLLVNGWRYVFIKDKRGMGVWLLVLSVIIFLYQKDAYVYHFGVPIPGHILEKTYYETTYPCVVLMSNGGDMRNDDAYYVSARIRVGDYWSRNKGTGNYLSIFNKTPYAYVEKIRFNGAWIDMRNDNEMVGTSNMKRLVDVYGGEWYVSLY